MKEAVTTVTEVGKLATTAEEVGPSLLSVLLSWWLFLLNAYAVDISQVKKEAKAKVSNDIDISVSSISALPDSLLLTPHYSFRLQKQKPKQLKQKNRWLMQQRQLMELPRQQRQRWKIVLQMQKLNWCSRRNAVLFCNASMLQWIVTASDSPYLNRGVICWLVMSWMMKHSTMLEVVFAIEQPSFV